MGAYRPCCACPCLPGKTYLGVVMARLLLRNTTNTNSSTDTTTPGARAANVGRAEQTTRPDAGPGALPEWVQELEDPAPTDGDAGAAEQR